MECMHASPRQHTHPPLRKRSTPGTRPRSRVQSRAILSSDRGQLAERAGWSDTVRLGHYLRPDITSEGRPLRPSMTGIHSVGAAASQRFVSYFSSHITPVQIFLACASLLQHRLHWSPGCPSLILYRSLPFFFCVIIPRPHF